MDHQEENIIRFPINRTKNTFDCTEYKPRHTNHRVPVKKVDQVASRINKILKTDEKKRSNYDLILALTLCVWGLLAVAIMVAFHRKGANASNGGLSSFEVNLYMLLTSLSISVYVLTVRAYNKSVDHVWKLIQKFLMDKNQVSMRTGYRWIIAMPSTNAMDVIPYRKLQLTNLELRKDYWDMEDLEMENEQGQQSSVEFPYIVRKNQYSYQFYTPRLSNFRFSLQDISKFFGKVDQVLTHETPLARLLVKWIEFSTTVLVTLLINLLILVLLKSKDQRGTQVTLFVIFIILYCVSLRIAAITLNKITMSQYKRLQNILILQNSDLEAIKNSTWELGDLIPMKKSFVTGVILVFGSLKLNLEQGFVERYVDDNYQEEEDSADQSPNMNSSMAEYFFPNKE